MSLFDFISSKTVGLALYVIPLLSQAFDLGHPDAWIYALLPARFKENGTLEEFAEVLSTGKKFMAACWRFTHK